KAKTSAGVGFRFIRATLAIPGRTAIANRSGPDPRRACLGPTVPASVSAMPNHPAKIAGVTVLTKANVYFDGNVISYTVLLPDETKKTLGLIRPGSYHFNTG